jgi:hypothetical protein
MESSDRREIRSPRAEGIVAAAEAVSTSRAIVTEAARIVARVRGEREERRLQAEARAWYMAQLRDGRIRKH